MEGDGATEALTIRRAERSDLPRLQQVREAAFAPVFASFRSILGETIYAVAQAGDDAAQGALLASYFDASSSIWDVFKAEISGQAVGFMAVRLDRDGGVGEIGLNAVHPDFAGRGIGTCLYDFALDEMTAAGLKVATVATGGDPSHAPARRAYAKAGFDVEIPSVWMCCDLIARKARRAR